MKLKNFLQQSQKVTISPSEKTSVSSQQEATKTSTESNNTLKSKLSLSWIRYLLLLTGSGLLLGGLTIYLVSYAYPEWLDRQRYLETDNAHVTADINPVTTRVAETVTEIGFNENQMVSPGMVLLKLDKSNYQLSLAQAKTSLELAKQQAGLAREKISKIVVDIPQSQAVPKNKNAQIEQQALIKKRTLQAQVLNQQKKLNEQQYKIALTNFTQKQIEVKKAELELNYTNIATAVGGIVGNKNVLVGQQVIPGQTLLSIMQPHPWIIAYFPEMELEKIQPGRKVKITVLAFANRQFQGKVDSIAFMPEDNLTSNSLHEIPVKIMFDGSSIQGYESRFHPGMSAIVKVEIK
ncbi:HlyD family efflux transporter periplasmic adaptor subunit [Nostoc sp. KVJ3]|uniref:HlyD family secretion protein n=1 Tax=Nostoc sp. KVJ3 TaxID=457945 RepID=UPI00223879F2|nr:efflux RND transporter periplasmic adaptor subunit [Nostoc sp. KVJ3]MCW5318059.1 HlyD family efflux transporter periplasmic adaptor subunit [Nostoc sp. KVJ3]